VNSNYICDCYLNPDLREIEPEDLPVDLTHPYLDLTKQLEKLNMYQRDYLIQVLWLTFLPLCEQVVEVLHQKKASDPNDFNIYNLLHQKLQIILYLREQFGNSPAPLSSLTRDSRLLFRWLTDPKTHISSSLVPDLKKIHKYLLLFQQLYRIPEFKPYSPSDLRDLSKNDLFFQMHPESVEVYVEIHQQYKKQMEEEEPQYQAYLREL
jgi:hypothetical protein